MSPTGQRSEEPVNEDNPTETQQLVRFRRRAGECSEVSRGRHDAKRHTSGRSRSSSEASNGFRCVGLNQVVVWRGLRAPRAPEHRLAIVGIGLGELVAEPFALPGVRGRDLRWQGQLKARLVERLARLHDFGAEPDRLVALLWIRQPGRKVRRVEGVTIARRGVDQDGDLRPGRPHGERMIVRTKRWS